MAVFTCEKCAIRWIRAANQEMPGLQRVRHMCKQEAAPAPKKDKK